MPITVTDVLSAHGLCVALHFLGRILVDLLTNTQFESPTFPALLYKTTQTGMKPCASKRQIISGCCSLLLLFLLFCLSTFCWQFPSAQFSNTEMIPFIFLRCGLVMGQRNTRHAGTSWRRHQVTQPAQREPRKRSSASYAPHTKRVSALPVRCDFVSGIIPLTFTYSLRDGFFRKFKSKLLSAKRPRLSLP